MNRKDSYAGRTFSLLHELCHLLLRGDGLCDLGVSQGSDPELETFCNKFAAEILVPQSSLLEEYLVTKNKESTWDDTTISSLARKYSVSREVILRRLLTLGRTSKSFYELKRADYQRELQDLKIAEKKRGRKVIILPPVNVISYAGKPFARLVLGAFQEKRIGLSDVSGYLDIKVKHVGDLTTLAFSK